ncbi:MAG TPA: phospholipase D-like domain-containing protein [Allosphingosinicella sp.]|nr:phospholipase D-like domain-containing protein [Allosphingosinicella sp.]
MPDAAPRKPEADRFALAPGRNCWRIERATRATLVVDAADYFRLARAAMLKARSQILLMGWDLDTRLKLIDDDEDEECGAPVHLGPFISWLAKNRPDLCIHILAWDGEVYSLLGRGTTLLRMAAWRLFNRKISFKLDSSHPREASHHHKVVVVDDAFAFCGGIDMTGSRWDTRAHRDDEPGRRRPTTHRRYPPWHDAAMAVEGDAARALGDLGRVRWKIACDEELECADGHCDPWPDGLEAHFRDAEIAVARTRGDDGDHEELREIEAMFLDMIAAARRFVYVENQYFASRAVAEAVARRVAEPDPPEFLFVNPRAGQTWLDEGVMGAARAELVKAIRERDHKQRFRIYSPVTEKGADIYVHAKIMIVDDVMLRVGSANMNNRSMGLDSECDVMLDAQRPANRGAADKIAELRCDLMAEHLGVEPAKVAKLFRATGSLIETVEQLRGGGRTLVPFTPPDFNGLAKAIARSEVADPDGADESFEPFAQHRLLRGFRRGWRGRRRKARAAKGRA